MLVLSHSLVQETLLPCFILIIVVTRSVSRWSMNIKRICWCLCQRSLIPSNHFIYISLFNARPSVESIVCRRISLRVQKLAYVKLWCDCLVHYLVWTSHHARVVWRSRSLHGSLLRRICSDVLPGFSIRNKAGIIRIRSIISHAHWGFRALWDNTSQYFLLLSRCRRGNINHPKTVIFAPYFWRHLRIIINLISQTPMSHFTIGVQDLTLRIEHNGPISLHTTKDIRPDFARLILIHIWVLSIIQPWVTLYKIICIGHVLALVHIVLTLVVVSKVQARRRHVHKLVHLGASLGVLLVRDQIWSLSGVCNHRLWVDAWTTTHFVTLVRFDEALTNGACELKLFSLLEKHLSWLLSQHISI